VVQPDGAVYEILFRTLVLFLVAGYEIFDSDCVVVRSEVHQQVKIKVMQYC